MSEDTNNKTAVTSEAITPNGPAPAEPPREITPEEIEYEVVRKQANNLVLTLDDLARKEKEIQDERSRLVIISAALHAQADIMKNDLAEKGIVPNITACGE